MKCLNCNSLCIKRGKKNGVQRYSCKICGKTQQAHYKKLKIPEYKYEWVKKLSNEGNGISSISRLLEITKSSVQRVIMRISSKIEKPLYKEENQSYEIDKLRTYCGNKTNECWIMYANPAHPHQTPKQKNNMLHQKHRNSIRNIKTLLAR